MNTPLSGPPIQWAALSPLLVLLGAVMVLLVGAALTTQWPRRASAALTVTTSLAVFVISVVQWMAISRDGGRLLVGDALRFDHFTVAVTALVAVIVGLTTMTTEDYLERESLTRLAPEMYGLYLTTAIGAVVMSAANDLLVLFLGVETLSLSLYVLAASHRRKRASGEAGLKYFILGGVASAVLLYGIALVYGSAGSTNYSHIVSTFDRTLSVGRSEAMALAGIALILVGMGFKAALAPFHFWTPDVYHGAPTPVTGFMASIGKAAAFAAMLRVLLVALPQWSAHYRPVVWVLAVASLVVGSVMAVVQTNVKRMLAFSSISHAGFLMVGVEAAAHDATRLTPGNGVPATMLYVALYAVLVLGTFAVVGVVSRTGDRDTELGSFHGLAKQRPALALAMTVLLVAQAGVPLTSGFVAKFGVIRAGVEERSYALAVIAMVAAVIAAYLYLRIMVSMWFAEDQPADGARESVRVPRCTAVVIGFAVLVTLVAGLFPTWLIDRAGQLLR